MEQSESPKGDDGDFTPAVPLEVGPEIASQADELLRDFAEDAGLETALVVDRGGALVAGVSEAEVTVEVISALVAGASGAMRALVRELGESGEIESFHQGGDRVVYLRELIDRFTLVGVSSSPLPLGIVREKANQLREPMAELLRDVPASGAPTEPDSPPRSLHPLAPERAKEPQAETEATTFASQAEFEPEPELEAEPEPEEAPEPEAPPEAEPEPAAESFPADGGVVIIEEETILPAPDPVDPETGTEMPQDWEADETGLPPLPAIDAGDDVLGASTEPPAEEPPPPPGDPREVIEPLDYGDPEVVIEGPSHESPDPETGTEEPPPLTSPSVDPAPPPVETPAASREPVESIFELEDDDDEEPDEVEDRKEGPGDYGDGAPPAPEPETAHAAPGAAPKPRGSGEEDGIFHFEEAELENVFEVDEEGNGYEDENDDDDEAKTSSEAEETDEVRSSGPFYF